LGNTSGLAITAFVLGILSIIIPFIGLLFCIFAIIFSIAAFVSISRHPEKTGKWMAIVGLILGTLAIFLQIIFLIIGALAYMTVLDPAKFIPERCTVTQDFYCSEFAANNGQLAIKLSIQESAFDNIQVTNACGTAIGPTTLESGESGTYTFPCPNDGEFTIYYTDRASSLNQRTDGMVHLRVNQN
jgi:hypothetical protein